MTGRGGIELTVVIDSVVRLREQQLWPHPDLHEFANAAETAGVDGLLLSLHTPLVTVRDRDWRMLGQLHRARLCLAAAPEPKRLQAVAQSGASRCVLVPGSRHQHSSGGALAVGVARDAVLEAARTFADSPVELGARVDPVIAAIEACAELGIEAVELNTAAYALASRAEIRAKRLDELQAAVLAAGRAGLRVSVRGGIDFDNVAGLTQLAGISEIRVGQAIVARALFDGLAASVDRMRVLLGD